MRDLSMAFDMVSPIHGAQMTSTNNYGSQNHEDDEKDNNNGSSSSSLRWMSSKMRMIKSNNGSTIISGSNNPDHCPRANMSTDTNTTDNNNGIRVCSDCNTTKTPLWRSGPQGPKSLCNACGIRQRKARKAAMEAAATTSSKTLTIKLKINKEKNKSRDHTSNTFVSQHINKKQTTYCNKQQTNNQLVDSDHNTSSTSGSKRQMFFNKFGVNLLSKNGAFQSMFPQDEEKGALLLMALSYGFSES